MKEHVEFEVFGKVHGVFFRKYTHQEAKKLKLNGWCKNTEKGTVFGVIQGDKIDVEKMLKWLSKIGSPKSKIEKLVVNQRTKIGDQKTTYDDFVIEK